MAIRNLKLGGTDWIKEHPTYQDLNDTNDAIIKKLSYIYADNTGSSSNSITETDLATVTITQNDLGSTGTIIIHSGLRTTQNDNNTRTCTFKLYINGVVVKTISITGVSSINRVSYVLNYVSTLLDTSAGNVIVKITSTSSTINITGYCDNLIVQGYEETM